MSENLTLRPRSQSDPGSHRMGVSHSWVWPGALIFLAFVAWESTVRLASIPEYLVPSPSRVLDVAWEHRGPLIQDFAVTSAESLVGFLLANAIALLCAILFFYSRVAERSLMPIIVGFKSVPIIAISPLLVLWIGYGWTSKVAMAAIVAYFPMVIGATAGLRSFSKESIDLMRSLSATRWEILTKLAIPSALPSLVTALKVSSTLAVIGAIVGELTGARAGVGFTILLASYNVDTPMLFAAIILSALIGGALFALVLLVEQVLRHYRLVGENESTEHSRSSLSPWR